MLLRGCGQWFRCGRERVARPSEQENLDPRPQRNGCNSHTDTDHCQLRIGTTLSRVVTSAL